ncbi:MAG: polymerase, sigma-24 subunit, subfamily [Mucilaginibacter sp.]|nr:polymerase, sigma-24 subunit, subfamily [Mucilaginibacter sp.]
MTDDALERRAQFSAFHEMHFSSILAYALRRSMNRDDACDVCAEAFLVAWRRFEDIPSGEQGRLWLLGVARRVLANHHHTDQRQSLLAAKLARQWVRLPDPEQASADDALTIALSQLRDDDRELLTLIAWDGLSPREAAAAIGVSAAATRVRLHRAKARLRSLLVQLESRDESVQPPQTFARQPPQTSEMENLT